VTLISFKRLEKMRPKKGDRKKKRKPNLLGE
jgi:hypothetical protein